MLYSVNWINDQQSVRRNDGKSLSISDSNYTTADDQGAEKTIIAQSLSQFAKRRDNNINNLSITLNENNTKATLRINYKVVDELIAKKEHEKINIYGKDIVTVWFNAWKYEREDQFALIALMKTIAYAIGEHEFYKDIKPIIIRGLRIIQ